MKIINEIKKGAIQAITIISILWIAWISYATWNSITQVNTWESLTATKFNELIHNQEDLKSRLDNLSAGKVLKVSTNEILSSSTIQITWWTTVSPTEFQIPYTPVAIWSTLIITYNFRQGIQVPANTTFYIDYKIQKDGIDLKNFPHSFGEYTTADLYTSQVLIAHDTTLNTNPRTYSLQIHADHTASYTNNVWYGSVSIMEIAN